MLFNKLSELFDFVAGNKLLSAMYALAVACITVIGEDVYNRPQEIAELRVLTTSMNAQKAEVEAGQAMTKSYDAWWSELLATLPVERKLTEGDALKPQNLQDTTNALIDMSAATRKITASYRARLSTLQIANPELRELRDGLVHDMDQADQINATRSDFLTAMKNDWSKAQAMAPAVRSNLDGWKAGQEADARRPTMDRVIEKVRLEFNDRVAASNAKLQMYEWRKRRVLVAWGTIGMLGGGLIGLGWEKRRSRAKAEQIRLLDPGAQDKPH